MSSPAQRVMALFRHVVLGRLGARLGASHSDGARTFLSHVGYLLGADALGTALTFFLSAWLVRRMGTAEFGVANLVGSTAQFIVIPMLLGLNAAAAQGIAAAAVPGPVIGSTLVLAATLIPLVSIATFVARSPLAHLLGVPEAVVAVAVLLAIAMTLQNLAQSFLTGLHRFREVGRAGIWASAAYASAVAGVLASDVSVTFWLYTLVSMGRLLVQGTICAVAARTAVAPPQGPYVRQLLHYGVTYTGGSIAYFFALSAIDTLMLFAYHGAAAAGIYGAYYATFNVVASRLTKAVSDVLLPTASRHGDPAGLLRRASRWFLAAGWVVIPGAMVLSRLVFALYGPAFPFSWLTAALLGACIYVHLGGAVTSDLLLSRGVSGARASALSGVSTGLLNVGANMVLIPRFGVDGCLVATALASAAGVALRSRAVLRGD